MNDADMKLIELTVELAERIAQLNALQADLARLRRGALRLLREHGYTLQDIGDAVGVSRQAIHRLTTVRSA